MATNSVVKVHYGGFVPQASRWGNRQPLAKSKGVHRKMESEGSWRQNSAPRNTNLIRHTRWDETAKQVKVQRLHGHWGVNEAGTWSESGLPYHGRSHGRAETEYEARSKACHEKSAEAIVPKYDQIGEGLNFTEREVNECYQMNRRTHKISEAETCPQKDRTESESYVGGQRFMRITENNLTGNNQVGYGLLEFILSPSNLNAAYKQVKRTKGAGGVDKMQVESLKDYLVANKDELITSILRGTYRPNPVRRVAISKDNGQSRQLGIPTVVDRVIQQAIAHGLTPLYEPQFSDHSYGFRPKRNAHQALRKCKEYITAGYGHAVDLDLEKFFDKVNHSKLIEVLSRTVKDGRVVSVIHKYLNAGVQVGGSFEASEMGVPQGGPLSLLLSNIMLHELDTELERRGHKFVRYADDIVILCKSKRSAERVMDSIIRFIEDKLLLKVNRQKSQTVPITKVKFLGYSFYKIKGEGRLRIHPKSVSKMKARLKELTSRSNGWGNAHRKQALRQYITGWVNYFKLADMRNLLLRIDRWYRRRIRMVIWKQWKRIKTKLKNLIRLGVSKPKAWQWANTRKGYWHIANSFILSTTITTDRLRQAGYVFLSDYYQKVKVKR